MTYTHLQHQGGGLQCSGHIYNHSFDAIERYTNYWTCLVTHNKKSTHGSSSHASQCVKSRIMNKSIEYILYIEIFEQQFVVSKGMLQSPRIEDHMKTIGIDLSLCNRFYFEHKCLNNIKIYFNMQVSVTTNKNSTIY